MAALVGRAVHVPRAVFAADIRRNASEEPPNGTHWEGVISEYDESTTGAPFTIVLTVSDEGELEEEEQFVNLRQVRLWIVDLLEGEDRATLGDPDLPAARARNETADTSKKRPRPQPGNVVFGTPAAGQR
jgi:hypothetical protein